MNYLAIAKNPYLSRRIFVKLLCVIIESTGTTVRQCLSQDFETGCLKLAVVKFLGVQIFKGDHNILIFLP